MSTVGRNDPCPCGSGKKYKHCHGSLSVTEPTSASTYVNAGSRSANPTSAPLDRQWYWSQFHQAFTFVQRGLFPAARNIMETLLAVPNRHDFDPKNQAAYSYAVLLMQVGVSRADWELSAEILQGLIDDVDRPQSVENTALVRAELSCALVMLERFEEAAGSARKALNDAGPLSPARSLAEQNLGRALLGKKDFDGAEAAYLRMIDSALAVDRTASAGIAAEWLARIALHRSQPAVAAGWCAVMCDVYRAIAPHHLATAEDLLAAIATAGVPPVGIDALPAQAQALRDRFPAAGEVGDLAGIHLDSLQVDLGALRQLAKLATDEEAIVSVPIPLGCAACVKDLVSLMHSEFRNIIPFGGVEGILGPLLNDLWPDEAEAILTRLRAPNVGEMLCTAPSVEELSLDALRNSDFSPNLSLVWRSTGPGPIAYGIEFATLTTLYLSGFLTRVNTISETLEQFTEARLEPPSDSMFIDFSARAWPRPIHTWVIGRGQAAVGGAAGPAHLAEELTRRCVDVALENRRSLIALGCQPQEADDLEKGGLIALRASDLMPVGGVPPTFIGTTPLNEYNMANPPAFPPKPSKERPYFVIDRHYNSWNYAPAPNNQDVAIYGKDNGLFRDHFASFHKQVRIVGSVRAKHYAIPIIDVPTLDELARITGLLDDAAERLKQAKRIKADARVWYRGQTTAHLLQRPEVVNRFLFGQPYVDEPSLPGAAPRRRWNYHQVHSFLSTMLQGELYRQGMKRGEPFEETHRRWRALASMPGKWDLGVMMLAQHYGIPTPGIDITHDPNVALWFATNRYTKLASGRYTYRPLLPADWGTSEDKWPVIYAIMPVTNSLEGAIRDVDLFKPLGVDALRPRRQKGAFFMGAIGLHQNRLAEALVCVLRLAPAVWESGLDYGQLFPTEEEDPIYSWMLALKKSRPPGDIGRFLAEIPEYE